MRVSPQCDIACEVVGEVGHESDSVVPAEVQRRRAVADGGLLTPRCVWNARLCLELIIGSALDYEAGRALPRLHSVVPKPHGSGLFSRDMQSRAGMNFGVVASSIPPWADYLL